MTTDDETRRWREDVAELCINMMRLMLIENVMAPVKDQYPDLHHKFRKTMDKHWDKWGHRSDEVRRNMRVCR